MNGLPLIALLLAATALLWALLLTLQTYEHRRYVRASLRNPPHGWHAPPAVLVCVPCKGLDLELADNLRCVLSQDYSKYQVRFIVDSVTDPACATIRQLMSSSPVPCELLVAGSCTESGQKVHNLCCATANLPAEVEVLAFFDSDAKPARDSLARLVHRVGRGKFKVATGYRWFVPQRPTAANLALASVNAAVAGLLKGRGWNLIWGGSWAVTRDLFERAGVADAWRGTLSDDLVASRVLRLAGAQIVFEPGCMAASTIDASWKEAASFLRRQFVIGRCYAPHAWWSTLPLMMLQPLVMFGGVGVAWVWARQGNPLWFSPLLVSAILYALAVVRSHWRQVTWTARVKGPATSLRAAALFDRWASPLSCLFAVATMLASGLGRTIVWRGIGYHMGPAGRITLLGRVPNTQQQREMLAVHRARLDRDQAAGNAANIRKSAATGGANSARDRETVTDSTISGLRSITSVMAAIDSMQPTLRQSNQG
ncbi:MAG TPA: glycosyltransferase [Lacipirellulaceae bacterium]